MRIVSSVLCNSDSPFIGVLPFWTTGRQVGIPASCWQEAGGEQPSSRLDRCRLGKLPQRSRRVPPIPRCGRSIATTFTQLRVAWIYRTAALPHDEELDHKAAFEATPILVEGNLFQHAVRPRDSLN